MRRIKLSEKWKNYLLKQPETGMGHQVVAITTKDNHVYRNIAITNCEYIDGIYNASLPDFFKESDIVDIKVTHLEKDKDFNPNRWNRFGK